MWWKLLIGTWNAARAICHQHIALYGIRHHYKNKDIEQSDTKLEEHPVVLNLEGRISAKEYSATYRSRSTTPGIPSQIGRGEHESDGEGELTSVDMRESLKSEAESSRVPPSATEAEGNGHGEAAGVGIPGGRSGEASLRDSDTAVRPTPPRRTLRNDLIPRYQETTLRQVRDGYHTLLETTRTVQAQTDDHGHELRLPTQSQPCEHDGFETKCDTRPFPKDRRGHPPAR